MTEGDAIALAWTVLLCLLAIGVLPWSWWVLLFPLVYVPARFVAAFLGGIGTVCLGALAFCFSLRKSA